MPKYRVLFFAVLLGVALISPAAVSSQAPTNTVAILVIDAFEVVGPPAEVELGVENCVVSIEGQDGTRWDPGSSHKVTSALHPFEDAHGRMVYSLLESMLSGLGAAKISHVSGVDMFGAGAFGGSVVLVSGIETSWMRDVETWTVGNFGTIYLVAVDTDAYDTQAVRDRITDAINLFAGVGATDFVLNMSFGLLPCDQVPLVRYKDYTDLLEDYDLKTLCDQLLVVGQDEYTDCVELGDDAALPEGDPVGDAAREIADPYLMPVLARDEFAAIRTQVWIDLLVPRSEEAFATAYGDGGAAAPPKYVHLSPALFLQVELPPFLVGDPLAEFFESGVGAELCLAGEVDCAAVAAAGNFGGMDSYAPGSFSSVVSVSAEYSGIESCIGALDGTGSSGMQTNDGEVQMNGLYNCLPGTSFAAPRLSFKMALYLLMDGLITCSGVDSSTPPLAHDAFDNMTLTDASTAYCSDFETLADAVAVFP